MWDRNKFLPSPNYEHGSQQWKKCYGQQANYAAVLFDAEDTSLLALEWFPSTSLIMTTQFFELWHTARPDTDAFEAEIILIID